MESLDDDEPVLAAGTANGDVPPDDGVVAVKPLISASSVIDLDQWQVWNEQAQERAKKFVALAPLPSLQHLSFTDYDQVYEPSDDTFLLLDALHHDFFLPDGATAVVTADEHCVFEPNNSDQRTVMVEIGCGSGTVSVSFIQQWQQKHVSKGLLVYATDINPQALNVAHRTALANGIVNIRRINAETMMEQQICEQPSRVELCLVHCNIATSLLPFLTNQVDVVICNPPYVPTPPEEVVNDMAGNLITAAWAGGLHGRQVIDRIVPQMMQLLRKSTGVAYLVTVDENLPWNILSADKVGTSNKRHDLGENGSFQPAPLEQKWELRPHFRRRARNEFLTIQKLFMVKGAAAVASGKDPR
jgi:release factor glutamine methyltransferase